MRILSSSPAPLLLLLPVAGTAAFIIPSRRWTSSPSSASSALSAAASASTLTDRQLQFWEDVESGLDDVSSVYPDESIDRIRTFARSAKGEIEPPGGYANGHEPSEEHVEGLTARPFWETTTSKSAEGEEGEGGEVVLFPWAKALEEDWNVIKEEYEEVLARQAEQMFAGDSAWQNKVMGEGWSAFRLQRLGEWNTENCAKFPKTFDLIRSLNIPLAVRGVCFARQLPGSGVAPHSDGRNFILTSHLGLTVPDGCWIEVGGERRTWEEGRLITLDTSFVHSTGNPSDGVRDVLIVDFWHPELSDAERACLEFVYDLRNKFERGDVPVRKPRSVREREEEEDGGGGLAGLWNSLTGGGGD